MTEIDDKNSELLFPHEAVTSLFLVRHGHTRATEEGKLYSDHEAELTETGRSQARSAGIWLKDVQADVLLSGTAKRVISTAEIISEIVALPVVSVARLNEWNVGEWEGQAYIDVKAKEPQLFKHWSEDPIFNRPPGGESIADVCERVRQRLEEVLQELHEKKIVLVTHAGVIRAILIHALGMPVANFWRLTVPVGTVSRVDFSKNFAQVHYTGLR